MRSLLNDRHAGPLVACVLFAALAVTVFGRPARAQGPDVPVAPPQLTETETADEQILKGLERAKIDGEGLVIVSGDIAGLTCGNIELGLIRRIDGKLQRVLVPGMYKFFGSLKNFRPKGLGAGKWTVELVRCPAARMVFDGFYATFEVLPGEVVDVGALKIDYTRGELLANMFTGAATIRLSVQQNSEIRMAHLRKAIPRVMARVKKRSMVLVGPAEQKVKFRTLLGS